METIRIQRANVILDISPDDKKRFMDQGYSVIDKESGEVIEKALPKNIDELQKQLKNALDAIEAQKVEIANLNSVIEAKDAEIAELHVPDQKKEAEEKSTKK